MRRPALLSVMLLLPAMSTFAIDTGPEVGESIPEFEARDQTGRPRETELVLEGGFRYQACDARICYPPKTIPLEWTFVLEPHDRIRLPESLRRGTS